VTFKDLSSAGLAIALDRNLMGENFTLRGATQVGIIDDVTASESFAFGGSIPSEPISVTMKLKAFRPALNLGEKITARGRDYTVRQISKDEISLTLICERADKR
jgi:hypothetical protein